MTGLAAGALARSFDALLFDLDGVVYIGPGAVPHAAEAIAAARSAGIACGYITNNAARPARSVADHLVELGIAASVDEVVTSPQAAVARDRVHALRAGGALRVDRRERQSAGGGNSRG